MLSAARKRAIRRVVRAALRETWDRGDASDKAALDWLRRERSNGRDPLQPGELSTFIELHRRACDGLKEATRA